jgi:hypothetical protein
MNVMDTKQLILYFVLWQVRVDISARNPGHIQAALTENRRVLNELVLEPLKAEQYYEVSNAIVFCLPVALTACC